MKKFFSALLLAGMSTVCAVVPIHYFPFDDNANDVVDGVSGVINGGVVQTAGYSGNAYAFDGSGWIDVAININSSVLADLTMGAWVQTNTVSAVRQAISSDNGGFDRSIGLDSRGSGPSVGWASFNGAGVLGKTPATVGNWTFIAVSYDSVGNTTLLYTFDESIGLVQTLGSSYFSTAGTTYTTFGRSAALNSEYFSGVIDNLFIYDQALTVAELDDVRVNGVQGVPEPSTNFLLVLGGVVCACWVWHRRNRRG